MSALLRFYFKVDPDELSDVKFAKLWGDLQFSLKYEADRFQISNALT